MRPRHIFPSLGSVVKIYGVACEAKLHLSSCSVAMLPSNFVHAVVVVVHLIRLCRLLVKNAFGVQNFA